MEKAKSPDEAKPVRRRQAKKSERHYQQTIFRDWCKSCGICSAFCPKKVIGRSERGTPMVEQPDECIGCRFCEFHCPDFALTITECNTGLRRNPV